MWLLFSNCFIMTLDVDCTARLNTTWWCVITWSQIAIMIYGWYHKVRHESVKKFNTLLGNTQFPDTVLYNKLLAMFVLLKLTWYDSILLKLRREKLKKSILRAGKKVFSIWRLRHRICDCVSFLESFQLSFHGFSHHFCMNSSLKNLMQTQVTRLARFISTKLATANRLRVSIGCRPCKNFHLIWFIIWLLFLILCARM